MTDTQLEHIATEMRTRGDAWAPNLRGVIVRALEESLMQSSGQGNVPGDLSSAALVALSHYVNSNPLRTPGGGDRSEFSGKLRKQNKVSPL